MRGRWRQTIGLLAIPLSFALLQWLASSYVIQHLMPHPITDGVHYIHQAGVLRDDARFHGMLFLHDILLFGIYPAFLALFRIPSLDWDWTTAGSAPEMLAIYAVQSLLLAAATAILLWASFKCIVGRFWKRAAISGLLGGLLLSPLVVVWPSFILMESLTLSALLLFASACMVYDAGGKCALALIGLSSCLAILIRDPIIVFFWAFACPLGLNILLTRATRTRATLVGLSMLLLAVSLGGVRTQLTFAAGKDIQPLVNIIQLRVLPDERRAAFLVARGLPMTPAVTERAGKPAQFQNTLFLPDGEVPPDFAAYRQWIVANGFHTYGAYLLMNPGYLVRSVFHSPNIGPRELYAPDFSFSLADLLSVPIRGYWVELTPYSPWLRDFLLAPFGWALPMLYLLVVAARYVGRTVKRERTSSLEVMALAASASIFVSYHADGLDLWRHASPFVVLIYLSLIVRAAPIGEEMAQYVAGLLRGTSRRGSQDIATAA